jgi:hypothetical protein
MDGAGSEAAPFHGQTLINWPDWIRSTRTSIPPSSARRGCRPHRFGPPSRRSRLRGRATHSGQSETLRFSIFVPPPSFSARGTLDPVGWELDVMAHSDGTRRGRRGRCPGTRGVIPTAAADEMNFPAGLVRQHPPAVVLLLVDPAAAIEEPGHEGELHGIETLGCSQAARGQLLEPNQDGATADLGAGAAGYRTCS